MAHLFLQSSLQYSELLAFAVTMLRESFRFCSSFSNIEEYFSSDILLLLMKVAACVTARGIRPITSSSLSDSGPVQLPAILPAFVRNRILASRIAKGGIARHCSPLGKS
jgi:hypothetical protein